MANILYWFGVAHAVAYAVAGAIFPLLLCAEYIIRQVGLSGKIVRAYYVYLKQKEQQNDGK